jgi:hypothetical protein
MRFMFERHFFVEGSYKFLYVHMTDVAIGGGSATQNFSFAGMSIGGGIFFPTTKYNPLFRKGTKRKHGLPNGPEPRGDQQPDGTSGPPPAPVQAQ